MPFNGASLAVIRSGQGDARRRDGFRWVGAPLGVFRLLVPPKFDRFPVGVGEVCGLLANGHDFRENFGGKPRSVPALGRDWPPTSSSLGAHATVVGVRFAGHFTARRKAPWGTLWRRKDGAWGIARDERASS